MAIYGFLGGSLALWKQEQVPGQWRPVDQPPKPVPVQGTKYLPVMLEG